MRTNEKDCFSFRIEHAVLTYGAGPFQSHLRASKQDFKDSMLSDPIIELALRPVLDELRDHLGPRTAHAKIFKSRKKLSAPAHRRIADGSTGNP